MDAWTLCVNLTDSQLSYTMQLIYVTSCFLVCCKITFALRNYRASVMDSNSQFAAWGNNDTDSLSISIVMASVKAAAAAGAVVCSHPGDGRKIVSHAKVERVASRPRRRWRRPQSPSIIQLLAEVSVATEILQQLWPTSGAKPPPFCRRSPPAARPTVRQINEHHPADHGGHGEKGLPWQQLQQQRLRWHKRWLIPIRLKSISVVSVKILTPLYFVHEFSPLHISMFVCYQWQLCKLDREHNARKKQSYILCPLPLTSANKVDRWQCTVHTVSLILLPKALTRSRY